MKRNSRIALASLLSLTVLAAAAETNVIFVGETRPLTMQLGSLLPAAAGDGFVKRNALTCQGVGEVTFGEGDLFFSPGGVGTNNITGSRAGLATVVIRNAGQTNATLPLLVLKADAQVLHTDCGWMSGQLMCATNFGHSSRFLAVTVGAGPAAGDDGLIAVYIDQSYVTNVSGSAMFDLPEEACSYELRHGAKVVTNVSLGPYYSSCVREAAGSCCGGCSGGGCGFGSGALSFSEGGGVRFHMGLGPLDAGSSAGLVYLEFPSAPFALSPSPLKDLLAPEVTATRNPDGSLASASFGQGRSLSVSLQGGALVLQAASPFDGEACVWTLSNPGGDTSAFRAVRTGPGGGAALYDSEVAWDATSAAWARRHRDADGSLLRTETLKTDGSGDFWTEESKTLGPDGAVLAWTRAAYTNFGSAGATLRRVLRDESYRSGEGAEAFFTGTSRTYWDDPATPARHCKPRLSLGDDGSWSHTAYDASGRVATAASPWLDGAAPAPGDDNPFAFPSSRVVSNDYASLDPSRDDLSLSPTAPRTVSEYIVPASGPPFLMSRVWRLVAPTNWSGEAAVAEISERAASATSAFGDPGNPRTVTVSYPERTGDWRSGRTLSVLRPDGRMTTTWYQPGEADPDGSGFTPGGAATHLRAVTVSGSEAHPSGIAGRTTFRAEVSEMKWQRTLLSETYVVDSASPVTDTAAHALVDWTRRVYDALGRSVATQYADGTAESNVWDCCHRIAAVGRDGSERAYGYDTQGRLFREEDLSVAALPGAGGAYPATDTAYDALGRTTNVTRRVLLNGTAAPGYAPLVTQTTYTDASGDFVITVDERGRETTRDVFWRYEFISGGGVGDMYRWSYADGSVGGEEQGWFGPINADLGWSIVYSTRSQGESVAVDGVLLRHSRRFGRAYDPYSSQTLFCVDFVESETLEDTLLGRTVSSGRPGFDGAWVDTVNGYDAVGRIESVETWCDTNLLSRTLYAYDGLGELYRTASEVIGLDGPDRVTDSHAWYEERPEQTVLGRTVAAGWWRASCSVTYPEDASSAPLTNSLVLTRLTGLGTISTNGLLTAETLSFDAFGAASLDREHTDPSSLRTVRQSFRSGVAAPATTVSVAGRTVSVTMPDGATTTYAYDGFGRVTAESGPRDALRLTGYNDGGEVDWTGVADGAVTNVTSYGYGWWDDVSCTYSTDPYGHYSENQYSGDGQMLISCGDANYSAYYAHDPFSRLTALETVRDVNFMEPGITRWFYDDASGLLTQKLYADGLGTSYDYTPDCKLASRTWASGVETAYLYDPSGQLTDITYSDSTPAVAFAYDRLGRQTSAITEGVSSNGYAYSLQGLLTNETVSALNLPPSTLNRSHDALGRPVGLSIDDTYAVTYGYDAFGRLSSVSNAAFAAAYAYFPGGFDAGWTITLTNGTIVSRMVTRDSFRGLVTAVSNAVNGVPVCTLAYAYDALGRVVSRNSDTFGYNPRSEVTSAVIQPGHTNRYEYDGIGNALWASLNSTTNTFLTNPLNQYTNILCASAPPREFSPTYDLDGNMITNGVWSYAWDGENRLSAVYSNSTLVVSNAYDHMSRRVLKVTPTATHSFIYDGCNLIQETISNPQSTITNHYVWGKDLSGTLQGAGGVGGLLAVSSDGAWHFPLYDNNGNVTAYVDESGALVAVYAYDAFGQTIAQSGQMADVFPHRFSTKYVDCETGLYYYGYRFYSPEFMRWMSRDPIGEWGGIHLCGYLDNNSINRIDYLGLAPPALHDFFTDEKRKAKYNVTELLEVSVSCLKEASTLRKLGNSFTLGLTGGSLTKTAISEGDKNVRCNCGQIVVVINPRLGTPPEIRPPLDATGSGFFGPTWGEIPDIFKPGEGWTPPNDLWGEAEKVRTFYLGPGGMFEYAVYGYSKANFNVGRFVDHKPKDSGSWAPITFDEGLFRIWRTDYNTVNAWQINASVGPVFTGDQVSIQIGCGGETKLAWNQLLTIQ